MINTKFVQIRLCVHLMIAGVHFNNVKLSITKEFDHPGALHLHYVEQGIRRDAACFI